jgi:hypothetical protein
MPNFKWIVAAGFLYAGLAAACGGGDSVSGNKTLVSLSDSEANDVCENAVAVFGPTDRVVDCGGGVTVSVGVGPVADCVSGIKAIKTVAPSCTATVDNFETCAEDLKAATDAQLCSNSLPASCAAQFACAGLGFAPAR